MRIDELDKSHQEFKKVILDQNLTEEQLDEILPALAMGPRRQAVRHYKWVPWRQEV